MLRLAYLYNAAGNKSAANARFERLANLQEGLADDVRGEAALRMAYISTGRNRGVWSERIIAGHFQVTDEQRAEAYRLAAGAAHQRGDLRRSIELYQESPEIQMQGERRSYILKELAGLYFEVAKGEGDVAVAEDVRPQMWAQARQLCSELATMDDAPEAHRMVGALMHAETYFFEGDFQTSYDKTNELLSRWGTDPKQLKNLHQRIYLNTAKTLQMQNCYILAMVDEATSIAQEMVDNRPAEKEEFPNSDSLLIGLQVLKLCAGDRGDAEAVARFGTRAWQHRHDYLGTEIKLQQRRAGWLARVNR